jgi:hypothetical protein
VTQQQNLQSFRRTADEIRSSALAYATGRATDEEFVSTLLTLEERKLHPYGVTLVVSHTEDGWVSILAKQDGTGKLWTAFEFQPNEANFRPFSNLSQYPMFLHPNTKAA